MKKGFTLIELIFVIVILGILTAIILPRFVDLSGISRQNSEEYIINSVQTGIIIKSLEEKF